MVNNIFNFFEENEEAVTSLGILLTFLVSSISLYFSTRNNKAIHYVNSVTKSRIEWIQHFRNTVAEFIANTNIHNNIYCKKESETIGIHLLKCQQLCSEIKLLLNYCDQKDKEIIQLCEKILDKNRKYCNEFLTSTSESELTTNTTTNNKATVLEQYREEVEENIELLSKQVQIYLKTEWNRVKYESQGKIYEKDTQRFDYIEFKNKYENPSYKSRVWKRFSINFKAKIKRTFSSPRLIIILVIVVSCIITYKLL